MKFCKYLLTTFIVILFMQQGFTQNYIFKHITTRDGLAGQLVTGFAQDNKGFIWITTGGGLQRFDGENFITYRHDDKDTASLAYDEVFFPVCDKENNIWVKSANSCLYQLNTGAGKIRKITKAFVPANNDAFAALCRDSAGYIWLSNYKAIYRYNYYNKRPEKEADFPDSLRGRFMDPMLRDPLTGHVWVGTNESLAEFDPVKKVFYDFRFNPNHNPLLGLKLPALKLFLDRQRNLWLATWDRRLYRYNLNTGSFKQFNIPVVLTDGKTDKSQDIVRGIVQDRSNIIWIGTDKGSVFKYDSNADRFNVAIPQFTAESFSNKPGLLNMFIDNEGNIWVATNLGVFIFNPGKQKIFSVQNNSYSKLTFPAQQVQALCETGNGNIYVASRGGGVSVFDEQMQLKSRLFYNKDAPANLEAAGATVWSICVDHSGKVWMAAIGMLICYDPVTKSSSILKMPAIDYPPFALKKDAEGALWIGGGNTLIKLNPATRKYTVFSNLAGTITTPEIRDILIDKRQNFWVATRHGLFRFDAATGRYVSWFVQNKDSLNTDNKDEIISLAGYDEQKILLGTSAGLRLFDMVTKKFTTIKCTDGSLSNVIQGVSSDTNGDIFTATYNGLYKIDSATHTFTHYDYEEGITDNQFYTKICRLRDGRMLAGGLNTFVYWNPQNMKETFTPPDVQVTGFKIFDKAYPAQTLLDQSNTVKLNPDQNFITIQYASLYYNAPTEIHYYYKLDGIDKNWVNAGNARSAVYTALSSGVYKFSVRCVNDDGIAAKNMTTLYINIATPWYKTWWFFMLCTGLLAAIVFTIYAYRARNRRNIALVRGRIASDLHDDIGSTLNSISVYSEVAGQLLQTNTEKAKTILETMGGASRSMIDNMNDIVWSINPKNDDFENILQRMQYFAAELLSAKNMLLQFDIGENVKKIKLPMDKRKNFYLVYKEAINNAAKYSGSKDVNVSIAQKEKKLVMIITDNGIGFDVPKSGLGGNGLKNMKARAAEMHAQLEISSWPGKGTRVYLKMRV